MSNAKLIDKLNSSSPWPKDPQGQVVFIFDARSKVELELLRQWVSDHASTSGESIQVEMTLADDRKTINAQQLLEHLDMDGSTVIAPLRVAWTASEDKRRSRPRLRNLLLGDPRQPNARRARRIMANEPERMHLIAGEPDTLTNLRERYQRKYQRNLADNRSSFGIFVARQAAIVLDIAERRLQGSRYKVPRYVAESLRTNRSFNEAVEKLAQEQGKTKSELMKEASEYMKEMISTPSKFWLDVYARFNNFCLGLGYEDRIVYDQQAVEQMRNTVRDYPSLLLWTHKTYLDGMVVPKVLYDNDFPMPHMFGGANINFAGIGFLIHRAGGIFIKRSFKDNELYKLTLRHYIAYLMEKRFPMNWSFEGTRSRMGKLMPPRYGLLKYVLEACYSNDARDIHIIPVTISYDLIRDVEEYATEQTGRGKGAESLRWFIGYIRSLARPMGKVYMDIGQPVVLARAPAPDDSLALSKIAFQVAVEANRVTPVTFPALVAMSLLGAAPRALTEAEVSDDLDRLLQWAEERQLRISADFDRAYADHMDGLLGIMINEGIITRYDGGPETVYGIAPEQQPVASYYRNTIIHFFINKAIIELALLKTSEDPRDIPAERFWNEVDNLRDLFKFEFFYSPKAEFHQQICQELERYDAEWEQKLQSGRRGITALLTGMRPLVGHMALLTYAEAYSVVADLASRLEPGEILEQQDCVNRALKLGRQAYMQRRISSESSIGKLLFKNGYQLLQHRQLIEGEDHAALREKRVALSKELREILRRLEVIRAISLANRAAIEHAPLNQEQVPTDIEAIPALRQES
ncbi:glycerol-3-phosphate 1-O-acyltransferase [Parahaliea sp. F7430]|uniref:Glycerol-3-phosphate acyltransferase n=1 Tax=Sediminihaliea albiluteola TaxID=2758564 RepID=A0A7W2TWW8_9GAMM|nr:glycerol-3-phosphate 1-O-acyltransferase [Sediminihaliea albiluteola]MBA6413440.1 glycerol-3-phosphate 1-O-acyltransferase [Sediminihaliea albiluteola]